MELRLNLLVFFSALLAVGPAVGQSSLPLVSEPAKVVLAQSQAPGDDRTQYQRPPSKRYQEGDPKPLPFDHRFPPPEASPQAAPAQPTNPPPLPTSHQDPLEWSFKPFVETQAPFYAGLGGAVVWRNQLDLRLGVGTMPQPYAAIIGETAAYYGENPAYSEAIQDSFENNWALRGQVEYGFSQHPSRWFLAFGATRIQTQGRSDIPTVVQAVTGEDFSNLINLLRLAGRSTDVNIEGHVVLVDLSLGRYFAFDEQWALKINVGVAKVVDAETEMSTELPAFDSSPGGQNLINATESDLEQVLLDYGVSPTLGLSLNYQF